jgi:hypothetical protein
MDTQESLREIENLRLRFRMNNRLRLESLAALSKIFREHGEPLRDELLASLVFAVPEELNGGNGRAYGADRPQDGQRVASSEFPPPEFPPPSDFPPPGEFPPPSDFPPPDVAPGEFPPANEPEEVPPGEFPPPAGFPPPEAPPAASAA